MKNGRFVAIFVFVLILCSCGQEPVVETQAGKQGKDDPAKKIVARYDGGTVTEADLMAEENYWHEGGTLTLPPVEHLYYPEHGNSMLKFVVTREHFHKQALEKGIDKDPVFVKRIRDLERWVLRQMYTREEVASIPDEKISAYYDLHKSQFTSPESYFYMNILIQFDTGSPDAKQEALEKANAALKELEQGIDFAEVERDHSTRPSWEIGQTYTARADEDIYPSIKSALETLPEESFSRVLDTRYGYMIVKLLKHAESKVTSLDRVRRFCAHRIYERERTEKVLSDVQRRGITINQETLFSSDRESSSVIAQGKDISLTLSDVPGWTSFPQNLETDALKNRILSMAQKAVELALTEEYAREAGIDDKKELRENLKDYRERILAAMAVDESLASRIANLTVSDEEAKEYFEMHQENYYSPRMTEIRVINIVPRFAEEGADPDGDYRIWHDAESLAWQLHTQLEEGADFEQMAMEFSTDYNSEEGGLLPLSPDGPRGHVVDLTVNKLRPGEFSMPVKHKGGFFIIRLEAVMEPAQMPFDKVSDRVREIVLDRKKRAEQEELLDEVSGTLNLKDVVL